MQLASKYNLSPQEREFLESKIEEFFKLPQRSEERKNFGMDVANTLTLMGFRSWNFSQVRLWFNNNHSHFCQQPEVYRLIMKNNNEYGNFIEFNEITIKKPIGKGSYGDIFLSEIKGYDLVVIKQLPKVNNDDDLIQQVVNLSKIRNPFIISYFGYSESVKNNYIIMEYAERGSLFEYIHSFKDLTEYQSNVDWKRKVQISIDTCLGLFFLHSKQIVHRDLRSKNILLDKDLKAKISDYGIAPYLMLYNSLNQINSIPWKSPETYDDNFSEKSDIFSLGMIFWEIASGEIPYQNKPPHIAINLLLYKKEFPPLSDQWPTEYSEIIQQCWEHEPSNRPELDSIINKLTEISNAFP